MPDQKSAAIRDIRVLLDYLDRSPNNRLLAQFEDTRVEDTRADLAAAATPLIKPPYPKYRNFLSRFAAIEKSTQEATESKDTLAPSVDPDLDDLSFLRWSRNFLAIVAAPATLDSIQITHEVIEERARLALLPRLPRLGNWWKASPFSSEKPEHPKGDGDAASGGSVSKGAKWLARSIRRLEFWLIVATIATVVISAYAMVGKYISDQRIDAQKKYQAASDALEADEVALKWQTQPDVSITQFVSTFTFKDACSVQQRITDTTTGQILVQKASAGASETLATGTTMQAAQKLIHDCEEFRQERYHLMAEDIRLIPRLPDHDL